jgi:GT2 family glycosyltransferase/SAM-dependent methyltransferase
MTDLITRVCDNAVLERDATIRERDAMQAYIATLKNSRSWRVTKPLRIALQWLRYGSAQRELELQDFLQPVADMCVDALPVAVVPQLQPESDVAADRFDILCFANIDWSARFQRPQQLMSQFARNGYRVFYIVPSRTAAPGQAYSSTEVMPGVYEIALQAHVLGDCYGKRISDENVEAYSQAIDELARDFRIKTAVSVVHLAFWYPLALRLRRTFGWKMQYDCMDDWVDFPGIGNELLTEERRLVAEADLVTVTAAVLYEKWASHTSNCQLLRNGVDFEFFERNCKPNNLLAEIERPLIGFYGGLAEWVDLQLIAAIADQRPDWNFVLIGDIFVKDLAGLDSKQNVHLLGRKPYEQMPLYLYRFDVCLIPFRLYNVTHAVDPVKFYEYISAGKPVVSVPLEEMQGYAEFVYFANGADEFIEQIERALAETDLQLGAERVALARLNDWHKRFEDNLCALKALHAKVSVIIVTYNNVELTQRCIESLLRNTTYSNYELIIVDNASSDDTRNYLRYLNRNHDNITIILNDANLGFAAANNQGLKLATGEYLLLLNNDTVVPKGWLDPLLRHLQNPQIGLVGPVTNAVGNEAKIEIDYTDIEGMDAFADAYTRGHRGRSFDIAMLAMFCVAMRREVFEKIGFLDERFGIGMFEDDDYSRRIQAAGLRTICAEDAFIHHYGQASFKKLIESGEYQAIWDRNQAYFESKWGNWKPHVLRGEAPEPAQAPAALPEKMQEQTALEIPFYAKTLLESSKQVTADHWSENMAGSDAFSADVYWLAVPAVQERHRRKMTAGLDYASWVSYCLGEFLGSQTASTRMLSIGCGAGALERELYRLNAFEQCDAMDISAAALEVARTEAQALGASSIRYLLCDIEQSSLPHSYYDAVWFNGSLHHIRELEQVCQRVCSSLKPGGWLFFNEYVGANHFAFDEQQRAAIRHAFGLIPEHLRRSFVTGSFGQVQEIVPLPDPLEVIKVDPSEAVRSADILDVVREHFDIHALNLSGGSLLQFLLHGIAGNFRQDDPQSICVLQMLFDIEDALIESGTLASDFVVVAATPKVRDEA